MLQQLDSTEPARPGVATADSGAERPAPAARPRRAFELIPVLLAAAVFTACSIWCALNSPGFLEADACTHYQYARFAFAEPHYFVNVWGRPFVTSLHAIPATLWGVTGVRMTSLACALIIAFVAWRIANDVGFRRPALAFIFTLAQPLVFMHSFSELTELPFAVLLAVGFWAYVRKQWFVMALMVGLTPTARPEGFGFILLAAVALLAHRKWWWLIVLPLPLLAWSFIGWRLYGQPIYADPLARRVPHALHWLLWLRHEWPYAQESTYASGWLLHFVALLPTLVSPLIFPFVGVGVVRCVKEARRHGGTKARSEGEGIKEEVNSHAPFSPRPSLRASVPSCLRACLSPTFLIAAIPLMILVAHSLLYWLGKMASNGELRYLIIVAPFWALLAAAGWEWTFERFRLRLPHVIAGAFAMLPMLVNIPYPVVPIRLSGEGVKARAVAQWYRGGPMSIRYPRVMSSNPEFAYHMGVSHTDGGWMRIWSKQNISAAAPGTLLIYDPIYAAHNADANLVITLDEVRAAGWIELPDVRDRFGREFGYWNEWRFFVSPRDMFGKEDPQVRYRRLLQRERPPS